MSSLTPPLSPSSGSTSPDDDSHMRPPPPPLDDDGHGNDRSLGDGGDPRHLLSAPPSATRLADRFQTLARISTAAFDEAKEEERLRRGVAFTPRSHSHAHHPGARRDSSASTNPPSPPPPKPPQPSSRHFAPQRTSSNVRNCDGCRRRKTKCDRGRPCGNCTMRKRTCRYSEAGPDPFAGNLLEKNMADMARLRQHVFMLARRLDLSEHELEEVSRAADKLDEDECRRTMSRGLWFKNKRPLSEVLRGVNKAALSVRGQTARTSPRGASAPSPSQQHQQQQQRASTAESPVSRPSYPPSDAPRQPSPGQQSYRPEHRQAPSAAHAPPPGAVAFSPYDHQHFISHGPSSSSSPVQVVHYVPYAVPPSAPPSSSEAHPSEPLPSVVTPVAVAAQPPVGITLAPPVFPLPSWSTAGAFGAAIATAQRVSPALLPPLAIPPSRSPRPSSSSAVTPLSSSAFSALRTASTVMTTPSSTAPSPYAIKALGVAGEMLPPPVPPHGGYRLPAPRRSPTLAVATGVGPTLAGFASISAGAGLDRRGDRREGDEGERANGGDVERRGSVVTLPPLRLSSMGTSQHDSELAGRWSGAPHPRDPGQRRLPGLNLAVSAERGPVGSREE